MYFSRVQIRLGNLTPEMMAQWDSVRPYAAHQWLWKLFPGIKTRNFLFRQDKNGVFYILSETQPVQNNPLFSVQTKPFNPQFSIGMELEFSLRANPVVTRDGKRHDVLMDVKFQAKGSEVAGAELEQKRQDAARNWLIAQGTKHGFELIQEESLMTDEPFYQLDINGYQQNVLKGPNHEKPVLYSTVDFSGVLRITDIALFREALKKGFGKSKAFGCGLLLLKKR